MCRPALETLKNARACTTLLTALFLAHTSVAAEAVQATLEFTLQKNRLRIEVPPGARAKPNSSLGMLIVLEGRTLVQMSVVKPKTRFAEADTERLNGYGPNTLVWLEKNDHELYYKARLFGETSSWSFSSYALRDLGGITVTCGLDFSSARAVEAARKACGSLRRN